LSVQFVLCRENHPSLLGFHPWNLAKDQKHEEPKSRES
jgi:hypothetical protein